MITSLSQPDLEKCNIKIIIVFDFLKFVPSKTKSKRAEYYEWNWVWNTSGVPLFHKESNL